MIHEQIKKFISDGKNRHASDVHLCADSPVMYRVGKQLKRASHGVLPAGLCKQLCYSLLTAEQIDSFEQTHDLDLMLGDEEGRYRVNISMNEGCVGAVIRMLPETPRTLDDLKLPPIVRELTHRTKGMVLLTGSTGQGKTTTMSAMIDEVNQTQHKHIITIEDPIEAVHTNAKSIIRQREVGKDTASFSAGLRAALRQDPDMIAIGEMRDYETIRIALTAAETGVLVISTLHVISIDKIIERLVSYSPTEEEGHIRNLLADCLQGIIHQELLPMKDGGKRVACEVLVTTDAVRNIIRRRGTYMLRSVLQTGLRQGMSTMSQSVGAMLEEGVIESAVAEAVLFNYSL
ncbi:MAG: PilT/PilU family type 4a pilus ATPase [Planctomycetes bacterium]|nr:PilT/PilU family type 4a pilus ATPase [Planctomycetota bacterium]